MIAAIVSSKEYFALRGNTTDSWVNAAFQDLLGRGPNPPPPAPDPSEFQIVLGDLLGRFAVQRQSTVNTILTSTEYRTKLINDLYEGPYYDKDGDAFPAVLPDGLMRRPATPDELAGHLADLQAGMSRNELIAQLISSGEYFSQQGGGQGNDWLNKVFLDLLDRSRNPGEAQGLVPGDGQGQDFRLQSARKLLGLVKNPGAGVPEQEYRDKVVIDTFELFLGRTPSDAERIQYSTLMSFNQTKNKPGKSVEFITAMLLSGNEYYSIPHLIP